MKVKDIAALIQFDDDYDCIVTVRARSQYEPLLYECSTWTAEHMYGDEKVLGISAGIDGESGVLSIIIDIA